MNITDCVFELNKCRERIAELESEKDKIEEEYASYRAAAEATIENLKDLLQKHQTYQTKQGEK